MTLATGLPPTRWHERRTQVESVGDYLGNRQRLERMLDVIGVEVVVAVLVQRLIASAKLLGFLEARPVAGGDPAVSQTVVDVASVGVVSLYRVGLGCRKCGCHNLWGLPSSGG